MADQKTTGDRRKAAEITDDESAGGTGAKAYTKAP